MFKKIVSGGQTGVDQGALDAALELGHPCGGWCPKDRRSEDGPIPSRYPVQELDSSDYRVRTRANVRDSDGTLILFKTEIEGGTLLTLKYAQGLGRPYLALDCRDNPWEGELARILDWGRKNQIATLNVAGPRQSKCPGIQALACEIILQLIKAAG